MLEQIGPKLTDVLVKAWNEPFLTKSDFARVHADYVAIACEMGYLTVQDGKGLVMVENGK